MNTEINAIEAERRRELALLTEKFSKGDGIHATAVDGLFCIRLSAPNMTLPSVYQPSICVILQGAPSPQRPPRSFRSVPVRHPLRAVPSPMGR